MQTALFGKELKSGFVSLCKVALSRVGTGLLLETWP